jgi:hypothetical protein
MEDWSTYGSSVVVKIEADDSSSIEQAADGRPSSPQVGKSDAGQSVGHFVYELLFQVKRL